MIDRDHLESTAFEQRPNGPDREVVQMRGRMNEPPLGAPVARNPRPDIPRTDGDRPAGTEIARGLLDVQMWVSEMFDRIPHADHIERGRRLECEIVLMARIDPEGFPGVLNRVLGDVASGHVERPSCLFEEETVGASYLPKPAAFGMALLNARQTAFEIPAQGRPLEFVPREFAVLVVPMAVEFPEFFVTQRDVGPDVRA